MTGRHHVESMWGREFTVRYVAAWDEFGRWYRGAVTAQQIGLTMPYRPLDRPVRHEHGVSGVSGAESYPDTLTSCVLVRCRIRDHWGIR